MNLKYPLRAWQKTAKEKWLSNGRSGIAQVVTGGGKTIFAEACLADFIQAYPNGKALIVVPTVALADQWAISLEEELGLPADTIEIIRGKKPRRPKAFVYIMVINTARNKNKYIGDMQEYPWMLIADECHRTGGEINKRALEGNYKATLGLSATPERQYDNALEDIIAPALGPIIYSYSLHEARRDGVISPFDLVNVRVNLLADEKKEYNRLSRIIGMKQREGASLKDDSITSLLRRRARVSAMATMRIPVAAKLIDLHKGTQSMIFHEDVQSAETIANIIKKRGSSVAIYHTKISPAIRLSNLKLYRKLVYSVLVSCRALDEGVNIPETQVAIIASSSASTRQRVQRLGRVLRPAKGKDRAIIYSIYATDVEEERLVHEAKMMEENGTANVSWMTVGASDGY